jgi:hypothetical protein
MAYRSALKRAYRMLSKMADTDQPQRALCRSRLKKIRDHPMAAIGSKIRLVDMNGHTHSRAASLQTLTLDQRVADETTRGEMVKRISIGIALAFSAILTYGLVISGTRVDLTALQAGTYQGIFTRVLSITWAVWSQLRGVQPFSHGDEFGRFYAVLVFLLCPLIGFGIFWLSSRRKNTAQLWKPLAIAVIFATPLERFMRSGFSTIGLNLPWAEVVRTSVVLMLMIWSVEAMRNHSPIHDPVRVSDNPPSQ